MLCQIKAVQVDPAVRVLYNPTLASRNFMVPGVLAMILMIITTVLTSLAIVKEKELGTLEQLIVTPITPRQLIIGKLTPFVIISLVIVTVVLVASLILFGLAVPEACWSSMPFRFFSCSARWASGFSSPPSRAPSSRP